jgi:hypothetical protein
MVRLLATRIALSVWVAVAFVATLAHATQQQDKPVKIHKLFITPKGPTSDSLFQMMADSDALVRGRVVGSSPRVLDLYMGADQPAIKGGRVMTAFRVNVSEILHGAGDHVVDTNKPLLLIFNGGDRDRGTYIERVVPEGMPLLEQAHEYVLFLKWDSSLDGWIVPYGPDGVLDIGKGVVESAGRATITKRHKGRPAADVLTELRKYGQK